MSNNGAIIPLQQDFEPENLLFVKLVQTYEAGTTKKVEVPKADGRSIEALLYCLNEFKEAAKELDYDTGAEYFSNYRKTLDGTTRTSWDNVAEEEEEQTMETWKTTVASFLQQYMPKEARQIQIDYLECLSKPKEMEVRLFGERLQTLVRYLKELPSEDTTLTIAPSRVKNILFRAMPMSWQTQFIRSKEGTSQVSFQELVQFMSNEKQFADGNNHQDYSYGEQAKGLQNQYTESNQNGSNRHASNTRGRNGDKHGREESSESTEREGHKKKRTLDPDEPCPLPRHENHVWRKCFDNPDGESYRPRNPYTGRREFTNANHMDTGRSPGTNNYKYNTKQGGEYTGRTHGNNNSKPHENFALEASRYAPDYYDNNSVKPLPCQQGHAMPTASGGMQPTTKTVGWSQPERTWY